jgi:hypothetical protein
VTTRLATLWLLATWLSCGASNAAAKSVEVLVRRVPAGGIQPQAAIDPSGTVHLIYFHGDAAQGDVYYCRSRDLGGSFSTPVRVNSQPRSVLAAGTIRGPQMALGRDGRIHVLWMGSKIAEPQAPGGATPLLYSRSTDDGGFEPQRNVIAEHVGLDGGGSIAADGTGHVYIVWHAPQLGLRGEQNRRVWITRSTDEGRTFPPEWLAWDGAVGCCGCCGIRASIDGHDRLLVMFRAADQVVHRDLYLLGSDDRGTTFSARQVATWNAGQCVMSTSAFCPSGSGTSTAWEDEGQVYVAAIPESAKKLLRPTAPTGSTGQRKNPSIAASADGTLLLAWSERSAWNSAGRVVWQAFDAGLRPLGEPETAREELPVWGLAAAIAATDGRFVVIY